MSIKGVLILVLMMMHCCYSKWSDLKIDQFIAFELYNFEFTTLSSYYVKLRVGSPAKAFNLLVDNSNALTWIDCSDNWPNLYNRSESSTATRCPKETKCEFETSYDGNRASGYMMSDLFHFNTYLPKQNSLRSQISARIVFGCTTKRGNSWDRLIDGVLGLGPDNSSLVSQLNSKRIAPLPISHCLKYGGGGYLILGEILEPGFMFSPLDTSRSTFNIALESILVNGRQVDSLYFAGNEVAIVDIGNGFAVLAAEIYDSLIGTVTGVVNLSPIVGFSRACYNVSNSDMFPELTMNFAGGVSMFFTPQDYMIDFGVWCIGFQRSEKTTIIGDMLLRNKIVTYDQPQNRIGWIQNNCSYLPVNLTMEYNVASARSQHNWLLSILIAMGVLFVIFTTVVLIVA